MPRVTRAKLRNANIEVLQDVDDAASVPLPSTPQGQGEARPRAPLGEIYPNESNEPEIQLEINLEKPAKQKARGGRKMKDTNPSGVEPEVVEDDCKRSSSPAAEEAARALSSPEHNENFQVPYLDRRPTTPPSKAVRAARRKLSPKPRTPKFDPELHGVSEPVSVRRNEREDSFVAVIETRSPAKIANCQSVIPEEPITMEDIVEDSFMPTGVTSISPLKTTRIEDSVEAIDALNEAIEQMESLPVLREDARTPSGSHECGSNSSKSSNANVSKKRTTPASKVTKKTATKPGARISTAKKVSTSQAPLTSTTKSASPKTSPPPAITANTTSNKGSSSSTSTTQLKPKARVSSIHKAPFIPTKSGKAPTRSTFTLPGEAVSAHLKAQREERLKREEEEKSSKRDFKARPAPSGRASLGPRPTLASQKRASLAKGELVPTTKRTASTPTTTKPAPRNSKISTVPKPGLVPRTKPVVAKPIASRPSLGPPPARPVNPSPNKASAAGAPPVRSPIKRGTAKGKEAFNRVRADKIKSDREKLEASKKARAEAAERGRIASREWAERRRKEGIAKKTETSNSVGMGKQVEGTVAA